MKYEYKITTLAMMSNMPSSLALVTSMSAHIPQLPVVYLLIKKKVYIHVYTLTCSYFRRLAIITPTSSLIYIFFLLLVFLLVLNCTQNPPLKFRNVSIKSGCLIY